MTRRKSPPVQVKARRGIRRPNAYRRLEDELQNTRHALEQAATAYTDALQALTDLLGYWDRPDRSGWTHSDTLALARIRKIAEGR